MELNPENEIVKCPVCQHTDFIIKLEAVVKLTHKVFLPTVEQPIIYSVLCDKCYSLIYFKDKGWYWDDLSTNTLVWDEDLQKVKFKPRARKTQITYAEELINSMSTKELAELIAQMGASK